MLKAATMEPRGWKRPSPRRTSPTSARAAYLAGLAVREGRESPGHEALVTSANLAALEAGRQDVGLKDLDEVHFSALQGDENAVIEIAGPGGSVAVPVEKREEALKEPWNGAYAFSKAIGNGAC